MDWLCFEHFRLLIKLLPLVDGCIHSLLAVTISTNCTLLRSSDCVRWSKRGHLRRQLPRRVSCKGTLHYLNIFIFIHHKRCNNCNGPVWPSWAYLYLTSHPGRLSFLPSAGRKVSTVREQSTVTFPEAEHCQEAVLCFGEGNRRFGVALWPRKEVSNPPTLLWGAWHPLPFYLYPVTRS